MDEGEAAMEYRRLGGSGFKVPVLSLGTGTFGGGGDLFKAWGASDVAELNIGPGPVISAEIVGNATAVGDVGRFAGGAAGAPPRPRPPPGTCPPPPPWPCSVTAPSPMTVSIAIVGIFMAQS